MCAILAAENKRIICYASFKGPCFGEQKIYLKYLGQNQTIEVDWIPGVDLKRLLKKLISNNSDFVLIKP